MNTNDVISIISNTLGTNFPNATIYKENIKQKFRTPSFFISEINNTNKKMMGNRYRKRFNITIKYFTDKKEEINIELHSVSSKLTEVLEIMEFKDKVIKGYNMESRIDEDVLHFSIDIYNTVINKNNNNKFGLLEVDVNAK